MSSENTGYRLASGNNAPKRAVIYARLSKDREGAGVSVGKQVADCQELADRHGFTITGPVRSDNDLTAFKGGSRSKPRPGYDALLGDIRDGRADVVLAWHTDRLHRDMRELEDYIDACGEGSDGVPTYTVKGSELHLDTSSGRMIARILGAVAKQEVEHMIERMKSAKERKRKAGEWHGGPVPYGYRAEPTGETRNGRVLRRLVIEESEAAEIRAAAAKVLAAAAPGATESERRNGTLRAICRDLNDRGVPTPRAARGFKPRAARISRGGWQVHNLRDMLLRPVTAGLITHVADETQNGHRQPLPSWQRQVVGKGDWEPVLTRETCERLRAVLTDPARRTNKPGPRYRWLLSGIAYCGKCGSQNIAVGKKVATGRRHYICQACFGVSRDTEPVDVRAEATVIEYLSHPGFAAALDPPVDVAALDARRAALNAELRAFARQPGITPEQLSIVSAPRIAELEQIEEEITAAYRGSAFDGIAGAADPVTAFRNAGIARQRRMVDAMLKVTILPVPPREPVSGAERQRRMRAWRNAGGGRRPRGPAFDPAGMRIEPRL